MVCRAVRWFVTTAVFLATGTAGPAAWARDDTPTRRDRFEAIKADYDEQFAAFVAAAKAAKTDAEREAAEKRRPSLNAFGKRFLTLAEEQPADEAAGDALLWIASNYCRREKLELDAALDLLEKYHLNSPRLKDVVRALAYAESRRANALAKALAEKAGDREVRGIACLSLGYAAYERTGALEAKDLAEVEDWMRRVQKDYADVPWEKRTLGELAGAQLFEVQNLIPGKGAPEIEGVGVDGKKIKLSDYRGKVVVLVFWGSWCGPCMAEVPHLRELTAKHFRRPFTVVGVNSGDTRAKAAKVVREEKMKWPVFVDGEDGPIVRKWNVTGFPMIYVIDAGGVIRCKGGLADDDPDDVIERLVRKAEQ